VLHALTQQVEAARSAVNVARSGFLPRLSGSLSYGRAGPRFDPTFTDLTRNNAFSAGLSLSWDVFNGFGTTAEIGQAVSQRSIVELSREQAERDLEAEVTRAHKALTAQIEAAEIARANREVAVSGLTLAEERFKAGAGSTLEVRDAQLKLTQAELSLVESRIDVEIARAALERAMGAERPGASK
jgi:outer membrane protein TolC